MAPRITIVTPSFNQGQYIQATIESVLSQGYPNLEYIVMDGKSRDNTLDILKKYDGVAGMRIISETDQGHADAVNKGFRLASGEIWGFLNSDDTLAPGALACVAEEIDSARGRSIVMGRCRFMDQAGHELGVEHPCQFESHRRVLEIWKGHMIPQPSTFWTPQVWKQCGEMDNSAKPWIDYDLFCRFSKQFDFKRIDQVLANYRLHSESSTGSTSEEQRLDAAIRISQKYWGPRWKPFYWSLASSLELHRLHLAQKASGWIGKAREEEASGRKARQALLLLAAGLVNPKLALSGYFYPAMKRASRTAGIPRPWAQPGLLPEQTRVYMEHFEPWSEGWVGPIYRCAFKESNTSKQAIIHGAANLRYLFVPLVLTIYLDNQPVQEYEVQQNGAFEITIDREKPDGSLAHVLEIRTADFFVPHLVKGDQDHRPLSWIFQGFTFLE